MKIDRRDMAFVALIVAVLVVVFSFTGKEKTKAVPRDATHRIVYQTAYAGAPGVDASLFRRLFFKPDKQGAEAYCEPCHAASKVPFPPNHPPKNRCLFCHKLIPQRQ